MMGGGSLVGTVIGSLKARCRIKRLKPEWVIACVVFCLFWGVSRIYTGPAYLSDEIGYLGHAAHLAGYDVVTSPHWHAGYSLLLAPLFRIFSGPQQIWQAVMVLNAALWAASFLVLVRLVDRFFPDQTAIHRISAAGVAMLYPTWLAMSGYAFSTTAIVLVFLLSVLAALNIDLQRPWSVVPYTLAAGFLYWIHPTGLALVLASTLALAVFSFQKRRLVLLAVYIALLGGLIVAYVVGSTKGFSNLELYKTIARSLPYLIRPEFWSGTIVKALGQVSYLIVSSFALAALGFVKLVHVARDHSLDNPQRGEALRFASLFVLLSMAGVILLGAAYFSRGKPTQVVHWIYGRYAEGVLLPFLAFGFLASCRRWWLLLLAGGLVACGALLNVTAHPGPYNNLVDTISFWPQHLIVQAPNYLIWMSLGALGVVVFQVARQMGRVGKSVALVVLVCASVFSGVKAAQFHQNLFASYSEPTGLVDIVRTNFEPGSRVGFNSKMPADANLFQQERFSLLIFYLYDYSYRKISVSNWLASCDGPLFTYDIDQLRDVPGVVLLGQEMRSGLYLVAKSRDSPFHIPDEAVGERTFYVADGWSIRQDLYFYGDNIASLPSQVGKFRDGVLASTGRPGLLISGPHVVMNAGEYRLVVRGAAASISSAWVDVVSSGGTVQHAKFALTPMVEGEVGVLASGRVSLDKDVFDLEVRVHVGANDEVRLDGYELVRVDVTKDTLQVSQFGREDTPSQVGELQDGSLVSTGQAGFLVSGPCAAMNTGEYMLVVRGAASSTASAWVAVVSGGGSVEHGKFALTPTAEGETGVLASGRVSLDEDVVDLEVRVYVGADDEVRLDSYELVRVDVALASHFERCDTHSDVGELRDGSLVSTGQAGFLVSGPYVPMKAGEYTLVVRGAAASISSAWVDVVSGDGTVQHAKFALTPTAEGEAGVLASGRVSLDKAVVNLEVRVYVGVDDEVRLEGYELVRVDVTKDKLQVSQFERKDTPSQVGELQDGSLISTGQAGFLVSGPCAAMNTGEYTLVVRGAASSTASAWVDVVSDWGSVQHAKFALMPTVGGETGVLASGRVSLDKDVVDLEVRVYVGADDEVRLDSYELVRVDVALASHFERCDTPSEVGELRDGSLVSTGQAGFLVYGPHVPMKAGEYTLVVKGAATSISSAWVDVASNWGTVQHAKFALTPTVEGEAGVLASGRVSLDEDVVNFEVRVYVGADDEVRLDSYELVRIGGTSVPPARN